MSRRHNRLHDPAGTPKKGFTTAAQPITSTLLKALPQENIHKPTLCIHTVFPPASAPPCTKVTCSNPAVQEKMSLALAFDRFESNPHAAETHGCSYAGAVFSRVFLAEAWRRRRILPGLLAVRGRIQVRLGHDAPHRARRTRQT